MKKTMAAIEDAERLVPWIEKNADAMQEPGVEAAVLRAFSGSLAPELAMDVPLLRFANPDVPAMVLLDAVVSGVNHKPTHCDMCEKPLPRGTWCYPLWVPAGASVVQLTMDGLCHDILQDLTCCGLSWNPRQAHK